LLEHLLLVCIGESNLDEVFLTTRLGDGLVVVVADDLVADVASLKAV
jgi:hypothetical protein